MQVNVTANLSTFNLAIACLGVLLGILSGAAIELFFHQERWIDRHHYHLELGDSDMKVGLISLSGTCIGDRELFEIGLALPGIVDRSRVVASLYNIALLILRGINTS